MAEIFDFGFTEHSVVELSELLEYTTANVRLLQSTVNSLYKNIAQHTVNSCLL